MAFGDMLEEMAPWFIRMVRADDEMTNWETCLDFLRSSLLPGEKPTDIARAQGAFLQLRAIIDEARGSKRRIERFRSNFTQSLRSEALLALAAVDNLEGLRASLDKQLPDLGVSRYLLSLFVSPDTQLEEHKTGTSRGIIPVAAFQGDALPACAQILFSTGLGIDAVKAGGRHYPSLDLLPEGQQFAGERMDLMVEPLFFGEDQYGYQVSEIGSLGENLYDSFRPQIAAALHTINLIRQLRDALDSLRRAQRQLVQSEKMASLGTLVAGFAHELNTPVGISITAGSYLQDRMEALQTRVDQNEAQLADVAKCLTDGRNSLNLLMANLGKASELVASFKRVAADQASEQRRTFALRQYLQQILSSLRPRLDRILPAVEVICPEDLAVDTYPGALFQVISNLLLNTVMHGYPNGKTGRASIIAKREGAFVFLRYEDDGIGIPESLREKVFDPFFTTARNKGGTGIGLHVVYNAVTQVLGGSISCDVSRTGGARFDVRIRAELSSEGS